MKNRKESPLQAELRRSVARRHLFAASAVLGAGVITAGGAQAQCATELDSQSGTSTSRLAITCSGTDADMQGDGTNSFVDLTVNGALTNATPAAINIGNNNTVALNNPISFPTTTFMLPGVLGTLTAINGSAIFTGPVGNTLAINAPINAGITDTIRIGGAGDVTGNTVTVNAQIFHQGQPGGLGTTVPIRLESTTGSVTSNTLNINAPVFDNFLGTPGVLLTSPVSITSNTINVGAQANSPRIRFEAPLVEGNTFNFQGQASLAIAATTVRNSDFSSAASINAPNITNNTFRNGGSLQGTNVSGNTFAGGGSIFATNINNNTFGSIDVTLSGQGTGNSIVGLAGQTATRTIIGGMTGQVIDNAGTLSCPITPTIGVGFLNLCGRGTIFGDVPYTTESSAFQSTGTGHQFINRATGVMEGFLGGDGAGNLPTNLTIDNSGTIRNSIIRFGDGGVLNLRPGSTFSNSFAGSFVVQTGFVPTANPAFRNQRSVGSSTIETTLALKGPGAGTVAFQFTDALGLFEGGTATTVRQAFALKRLSVDGGTWTATGANTSFQTATVNSGATLLLNGSITGALNVASGGTIGGTGTAGITTVNGTITPGLSIGTFNTGALTFGTGSTYDVEVGNCGVLVCADLISALGPAILDGTVRISAPTTFSPFSNVPILAATSLTGQFATLTRPAGSNPFHVYSLSYSPTQVLVNMALFVGCVPELDGQSGTASARLAVGCAGTDPDQQGDGTNDFVDVFYDGPPGGGNAIAGAIRLDSNNTVTIKGPVNAAGGIVVGPTGNTIVIEGLVASGNNIGIGVTGAGDVTGNTVTVGGGVFRSFGGPGVDISSTGGVVSNNTFAINNNVQAAGSSADVFIGSPVAIRDNTITVGDNIALGAGDIISILLGGGAPVVENNTFRIGRKGATVTTDYVDLTLGVGNVAIRNNAFSGAGRVVLNGTNTNNTFLVDIAGAKIGLEGASTGNTITIASTGVARELSMRTVNTATGRLDNNVIDNSGLIACPLIECTRIVDLTPDLPGGEVTIITPALEINAPFGGGGNRLINRASGILDGQFLHSGNAAFTIDNFGTIRNSELILSDNAVLAFNPGYAFTNSTARGQATTSETMLALKGPGAGSVAFGNAMRLRRLLVDGGTWTASGADTSFITALVNSGATLRLNGSTGAAMTVAAGGRLEGTGTAGATTVGGTIAPGNSIGTLNVNGALIFNTGSTYDVEIGSCSGVLCADRIAATGAATINGGTVNVIVADGLALNGSVPILTASSLTGQFAGLTQGTGSFFRGYSLSYLPTQVLLTYANREFDAAAQSENQASVANALDAAGAAAGPYAAVLGLQSAAEAQAAFDTLSGVTHGSTPRANEYAQALMTGMVMDRLSDMEGKGPGGYAQAHGPSMNDASAGPADGGIRPWTAAFGGAGHIGAVLSRPRTEYDVGGAMFGLEAGLDDWTLGAALGLGSTDGDVGADTFETRSLVAQLYAGTVDGPFEFRAATGAGKHDIDSRRVVAVGATTQAATASYLGWTAGAAAEAGYGLDGFAGLRMTPFVGADYLYSARESFTETQSSLGNLRVSEASETMLRLSVGSRFATEAGLFDGLMWPSLRVAYVSDVLDEPGPFTSAFAGAPTTTFAVEGATFGRERLMAGARLDFDLGPSSTLGVSYDGEFAEDDAAHMASANFRMRF